MIWKSDKLSKKKKNACIFVRWHLTAMAAHCKLKQTKLSTLFRYEYNSRYNSIYSSYNTPLDE